MDASRLYGQEIYRGFRYPREIISHVV
jgi:putative transposase